MVVDARQLRVLKAEIQSDLRAIRRLDEAVAEARPMCTRSRHPFARGNCWEEVARPCRTSHVARLKGGLVCGNGAVQSA